MDKDSENGSEVLEHIEEKSENKSEVSGDVHENARKTAQNGVNPIKIAPAKKEKDKMNAVQWTALVLFIVSFVCTTSYVIYDLPQQTPSEVNISASEQTTVTSVSTAKSAAVTMSALAETTAVAVFPIDINTAEIDALMQLSGIGETLAGRIISYRNGGNYFYSVDELRKVLGIGQSILEKNVGKIIVYRENLPQEKIPETVPIMTTATVLETTDETFIGIEISNFGESDAQGTSVSEVEFPLDINSCSEEDLQLLSGIGPVTARKIVLFRLQNGGFYDVEEIMSVSGIGRATFAKIRSDIYADTRNLPPREDFMGGEKTTETADAPIVPVNLNSATFDQLELLPGLSVVLSQRILTFRDEVKGGKFESLEELFYVEGVTKKVYNKVVAFLYL